MIELSQVCFAYNRKVNIFDELNLTFSKGHIYGLLGKNGTGKSTLLKLVSGMIFAKSGTISTMGYTPAKRSPLFMTELYYITEETYAPAVTMKQYAKLTAPFYKNFSYDQLWSIMEEFDVDANQKLSSMSLGQKKKAMISFALACNTKLLIADEPTNGLDIPSKVQFRNIISRVSSPDRCIIISTHQVRDLEDIIDSIVVLDGKEIVANSSVEDICRSMVFKVLDSDLDAKEDIIYEEQNLHNRYGIVRNSDNIASRIDIELFFNAAISQSERINQVLTERGNK